MLICFAPHYAICVLPFPLFTLLLADVKMPLYIASERSLLQIGTIASFAIAQVLLCVKRICLFIVMSARITWFPLQLLMASQCKFLLYDPNVGNRLSMISCNSNICDLTYLPYCFQAVSGRSGVSII